MKEELYPQIKFTQAVHPEHCTIKRYDDGDKKEKYCILQDIKINGESVAVSVIAVSESRKALLDYLYDNGAQYSDYFG